MGSFKETLFLVHLYSVFYCAIFFIFNKMKNKTNMKLSRIIVLLAVILIFSLTTSCIVSNSKENTFVEKKYNQEDYGNVEAAILDYVEALYLVDSSRIIKSVDPKLRKVGYYYNPSKKAYVDNLEMTHKQLVRLAARWNSESNQANENSPKKN